MDGLFKSIGNNIRTTRLRKNVSLKQLSDKTGIKEQYLRRIEKAKLMVSAQVIYLKLQE